MKQYNIQSCIISIFFFIIISSPLVVTVLSNTENFSANEKRTLSSFPRIDSSAKTLLSFPKKFEAFFEDHFGFRDEIVKLHNWVLWRVFAASSNSSVVIGNDDWVFLIGDGGLKDYLGQTQFNTIELERYRRVIKDREYWLKTLGTRYLFLPIPNKEAIYGEHLPFRIQQNKGRDKYTQIINYLKSFDQDHSVIDVQELMMNNKAPRQLYHRTDSHWNSFGVHLVYGEILRRLQPFLPGLEPVKLQLSWQEKYSGDLAILMNLKGILSEMAPIYEVQAECAVRPFSRMKELLQTEEFKNTPLLKLPVKSGCEDKKYNAIVIHDSFGNSLRQFLTPHFQSIMYVQHYNHENIQSTIAAAKPDLVIDERVSRNLEKALIYDQTLENKVLQIKFAELPRTVLNMDGSNWQEHVGNSNEVSLNSEENHINFNMENYSSRMSIAIDSENDVRGSYAFKLSVHSIFDTTVSACYSSTMQNEITNKQCEERPVYKGQNMVYFRFFQPGEKGVATLKFGNLGIFQLHSLVVKIEND